MSDPKWEAERARIHEAATRASTAMAKESGGVPWVGRGIVSAETARQAMAVYVDEWMVVDYVVGPEETAQAEGRYMGLVTVDPNPGDDVRCYGLWLEGREGPAVIRWTWLKEFRCALVGGE